MDVRILLGRECIRAAVLNTVHTGTLLEEGDTGCSVSPGSKANAKPTDDKLLWRKEMMRMIFVSEASLLMITQTINFHGSAYKVPCKTLFKVPYKAYSLTDDLEWGEVSKQCAMSK